LIWFRRKSAALRFGDYAAVDGLPPDIYAYTRTTDGERVLVALNFADAPVALDLPEDLRVAETLIGTHDEPPAFQRIDLRANEGRLLRLA
jgi:glycosidase